MSENRFKAVALDLFDTLVKWDLARLPLLEFHERKIRSTVPCFLPRLQQALGKRFDLEVVLQTILTVFQEVDAERKRDGIEITCRDRFERTLERLGEPPGGVRDLAAELTRLHMAGVRTATSAPQEHVAVVRRLASTYRLGLLSNFDDSQTGHEIIADTGLAELFEVVLLSADMGLRKPNPLIFRCLLDRFRLQPSEVLFVGDTVREDIVGARSVGMPVAWLSEGKDPLPEGISPPDFTLPNLTALPSILELD